MNTTITTGAPAGAAPMGEARDFGPSRSQSLLRFLPHTDKAVMFAWVVATSLPMGGLTAVRYLCIGYFLACTVLCARQALQTYLRGWPTLIIPILCVISAIWSQSSSEAVRKGMFMFLTTAVADSASARLHPRSILIGYVAGALIGAPVRVAGSKLQSGSCTGAFGPKNYLALQKFILFVFSCALLQAFGPNHSSPWSTHLTLPLAAG